MRARRGPRHPTSRCTPSSRAPSAKVEDAKDQSLDCCFRIYFDTTKGDVSITEPLFQADSKSDRHSWTTALQAGLGGKPVPHAALAKLL